MAIRYVSSLATGSGDGTFEAPWTIRQACLNTASVDEARIMADGVYLPLNAAHDVGVLAGTEADYPVFIGANASGDVDGTRPIIDGTGRDSSLDMFRYTRAANGVCKFKNLIIRNFPNIAISQGTSQNLTLYVDNCDFDTYSGVSNVIRTIYVNIAGSRIVATNCLFSNCKFGIGSAATANALPNVRILNSRFIGITNSAIFVGGTENVVSGCSFIRCGVGINNNNPTNTVNNLYIGNSFLNCTTHGINLKQETSNSRNIIANNIFRSCGGFAINTNTGNINQYQLFNNCFSNNTSGNVDINGGVVWGDGNILADPKFVSETSGSENLTLQATSPCLNTGFGLAV